MAKTEVVNDGHDDKFEELLERIGDEEFLIEKIVEKVIAPTQCLRLGMQQPAIAFALTYASGIPPDLFIICSLSRSKMARGNFPGQ